MSAAGGSRPRTPVAPGRSVGSSAVDDRRAKLERLREQGIDPFPHEFDGVVPIDGSTRLTTASRPARKQTAPIA